MNIRERKLAEVRKQVKRQAHRSRPVRQKQQIIDALLENSRQWMKGAPLSLTSMLPHLVKRIS